VIFNTFENDIDDPLLKKSNTEKTKVVFKNSLFDQLYNINRFGENEMQKEKERNENILPVEDETLILIEDSDLNIDAKDEVIIKKEEKIAQPIDLLDFFESNPEPIPRNFDEFPIIHLKAPETLKIIPNLYE
jgi:hypothetical protein